MNIIYKDVSRIVKLLDIGYRIFEQNVTLDIRYPLGYPRRRFLRVGYPTFSGYLIGCGESDF